MAHIDPTFSASKENINHTIPSDIYYTGNPQITFFKSSYRRHTKFISNINEIKGIQNGIQICFDLNIDVDLLSEMYILLTPQILDNKLCLMDIIDIKFIINDKIIEYNSSKIINMFMKLFDLNTYNLHLEYFIEKKQLYIPLYFVFNNPGLSLPFFLKDSHDQNNSFHVDITMKTEIKLESQLFYKYFILDEIEYRRFNNVSHEYLHPKLTDYSVISTEYKSIFKLPFNGSIKWLLIEINPISDDEKIEELLNYAKLFLNDKFITMTTPLIARNSMIQTYKKNQYDKQPKNFYLIPFCLNILKHQPSGTLTILNGLSIELDLNCQHTEITFYAMYYNILQIDSKKYMYNYNVYSYPNCTLHNMPFVAQNLQPQNIHHTNNENDFRSYSDLKPLFIFH